MSNSHFKRTDKGIIALVFALYILGYHFLMSSGSGKPRKGAKSREITMTKNHRMKRAIHESANNQDVKSLQTDWPLDLGRYYYTIDIDPGYEIEEEVFEVVGKSGDNLLLKRHNDWPDISGHFEWYCNDKLTSTQQMYDYVVSHRKAILRQMQEVGRRGISREFDEASYFQDHYDEYLDDPEDEIRFPPEIFDANEE